MGCGIEHMSGRQFVYFTKNGQTVSIVMLNFWHGLQVTSLKFKHVETVLTVVLI